MHRLSVPALAAVFVLSSSNAALAYKHLGIYWQAEKFPVVYHLNEAGTDDISDGSDLDAVDAAFHTWSCVEGSYLRFFRDLDSGPAVADHTDRISTVFWDETDENGLGQGTLSMTKYDIVPNPDEPVRVKEADIIFNGLYYNWTTEITDTDNVDIETVALHEIGHMLGLADNCDDEFGTDCEAIDFSVMVPREKQASSLKIRTLFADDEEAVRTLYPSDDADDSHCEGPFRQGERCSCNDDCSSGLVCAKGDASSEPLCVANCGENVNACPEGFVCLLAAREDDGTKKGSCVRFLDNSRRPISASCNVDADCVQGDCVNSQVVGHSICYVYCESASDCGEGYLCTDNTCTSENAGVGLTCESDDAGQSEPEPDPDPDDDDTDGCVCVKPNSADSSAPWAACVVALIVGSRWRRRRN